VNSDRRGYKVQCTRRYFVNVEIAGPDFVRRGPTVDVDSPCLTKRPVRQAHAVTTRAAPRVEPGATAKLQRQLKKIGSHADAVVSDDNPLAILTVIRKEYIDSLCFSFKGIVDQFGNG
jgi:hypothetical protein